MNGLEPFISFDNFNKKVNIDKTHELVTADGDKAERLMPRDNSFYPISAMTHFEEYRLTFTHDGSWHTDSRNPERNLMLRRIAPLPYVIDPATNKKVEDAIYVPVGKSVVLYGESENQTVVVRSISAGNLIVTTGHNTGYQLVKPPQPEKTFHGLNKQDFLTVVKELVGDNSVWKLRSSVTLGSNGFLTYIESDDNGEVASISVKDDGFIAVSSKLNLNWIGAYKLLTSKWVD